MKRRAFSRHLPALHEPAEGPLDRLVQWVVLGGFAAGLLALAYFHPIPTFGFLLFYTIVGWVHARIHGRRLRALAASRPGNALCRFARAFDLRAVDPWIVRATFEEIQKNISSPCAVPIQPSDGIVDLTCIHPDDVEDIARDIAERAGYSFDDNEENPFWGRVDTIEDLVQFFMHQPRRVEV